MQRVRKISNSDYMFLIFEEKPIVVVFYAKAQEDFLTFGEKPKLVFLHIVTCIFYVLKFERDDITEASKLHHQTSLGEVK